uniref:Uncharacterized protein n=1 Tax=Picea glauca TaxID=3330 RepID=A0A101M181_PICGL|nr:hypothetical protein ABT39_MTgene3643 [Picea glauca]QHR86406.1 hypothetical protein Q903MT_gene405 [Picea sitchensis]
MCFSCGPLPNHVPKIMIILIGELRPPRIVILCNGRSYFLCYRTEVIIRMAMSIEGRLLFTMIQD